MRVSVHFFQIYPLRKDFTSNGLLIVYERPHDTFCNTFCGFKCTGFVGDNCMGRLTCPTAETLVGVSTNTLE